MKKRLLIILFMISVGILLGKANLVNAETIVDSGSCGDTASWTVTDSDGKMVLTIQGTGAINDYENSTTPWSLYQIQEVVIEEGITHIGDYALFGLLKANSIILPQGITSIGEYAFHDCKKLQSIIIPEGVTSIGESAFGGCTSLTNITIRSGITSISAYLFENCISLESITIPEGVTSVECGAFDKCSKLVDVIMPETLISIEDYAFHSCRNLSNIVLPEGVTSIGCNSFDGCSSLLNISIPNNVTSIGAYAFDGCSSLLNITIPNGVTSLADNVFSHCSSLTSIVIPDNVTSIGFYAFANCTHLVTVTIPESVVNIYDSAFSDCSELAEVFYGGPIEQLNALYSFDENVHIICAKITEFNIVYHLNGGTNSTENPDSYTVEDTVSFKAATRKGYSFDGWYTDADFTVLITGVPKGSIGDKTLYAKWLPEDDTLDSGTCGDNALWVLTGTSTDMTLTIYGTGSMKDYSYWDVPWKSNRSSIKTVIVEESINRIGANSFSSCSNLDSITIPESVTSIGDRAFRGCSSLTSITIPNGVTSLDEYVFSSCSNLSNITIPNSVASIGAHAFDRCTSLVNIIIPDSVTSIGASAFTVCRSLNSVTLSSSLTNLDEEVFSFCTSLLNITIPNSVTSIGSSAFYGCSSLTSVVIPSSVTDIGSTAFQECNSLASITIPDSVTSIGTNAFVGCSSLVSLTLSNSVTKINDSTFSGCSSLTTITLSNSVKHIGYGAFSGCENVRYIFFMGTEAEWTALIAKTPQLQNKPVHYNTYDHTWDTAFIIDKEATCIETGSQSLHCIVCDMINVNSIIVIPITDHHYGAWEVTKKPSFIEEGQEKRTCVHCGVTETRSIPILDGATRIFGSGRFETAFLVADQLKEKLGVEEFDAVILADGRNYPDALAGSYLSSQFEAPILLVNKSHITAVQDYIRENMSEEGTIYILGGTGAVPDAVMTGMDDYTFERLAGKDRYATNIEILNAGPDNDEIVVCTGKDYADSLSASAVGRPILLVKNTLQDSQKAYLESLEGERTFCIIGGEGAVTKDVENALKAYGTVKRVFGASRYDTSVAVAEEFFPGADAAVLAYGQNFPDGLCGGALAYYINGAGGEGAPLILTRDSKAQIAAAFTSEKEIRSGAVLGGAALISDESVRAVFQMEDSDEIEVITNTN